MIRLHICLFEPEIPQNTGNIMRTCVATNTRLHLIEPLGFELSEKTLKRAGMDYLLDLDYNRYAGWQEFVDQNPGHYVFVTRYAKQTPKEINFKAMDGDVYLVFGKESTGIPYDILHHHLANCVRLPMVPSARSLNLANCVAIMTYHALGEWDYLDLCQHESLKGEDWIYAER
jgi:tRNA (cytidine/uridine-2'-O-)-methyltransferase